MYNFKIVKTSNDVEDLCVTFGVVALIKNAGEEVLRISDKGSFYNVQTEEFDLNDIGEIGYELEKNEEGQYKVDNLSDFLTQSNIRDNEAKIQVFLKEFAVDTFSYLLNLESKNVDKEIFKYDDALFCGSVFYVRAIRKDAKICTTKVMRYKRILSLIGWVEYVNIIKTMKKNSTVDNLLYLIPIVKDTEQLSKISWSKTKKDGEITEIRLVSDESVNSSIARLNISLMEYEILSDGYDGYYLVSMMNTSKKPIIDKVSKVDFLEKKISFQTREYLKKKFMNIHMKEELSKYILNMSSHKELSKLIKIMARKDFYEKNGKRKISYIDKEVGEEMIGLQNNNVIKIYKNETVIKLGKGLNRLLNDNKGYQSQVLLLNAKNLKKVMSAIKLLTMEYKKAYTSNSGKKANLISEDDINNMFELLENADSEVCGVVADAIIFNSKIFTNSRENKINKKDGN